MSATFEIRHPLPNRRSAEALRDQIIDHLVGTRPAVGERFLSEYELARAAGLSRPTVRRALEELAREGWIERRSGMGTFVGPRVALPLAPRRSAISSTNGGPARHVARLAVLVHTLGDFRHDWYTPAVLGGIDEVAHDQGVSIELVGDRDGDIRNVSQRLMQNRPDALACVAPALRHAGLIAEAQRLDVPCIGTGGLLAPLGVPCVSEDGVEGGAMAVRHLAGRGHRRIGFVQVGVSLPWVFQRHQGYLKGLRDSGLPTTNELAVFLSTDQREPEHTATLARFIRELRPTALLLGNFWPLQYLAPLIAAGELRVPQDVSVVTFDQHPDNGRWLGGVEPTVVELPLREMGRRLAGMARELVDGKPLAPTTTLPCTLREGASVRTIDVAESEAANGHANENGKGNGRGHGNDR